MMKTFGKLFWLIPVLCVVILVAWRKPANNATKQLPHPKYNVLFIFIDDLRPELGCYGQSYIKSPNIDGLAASSTVFTRQYVTVPTCGASRASLLCGMRPRTTYEIGNEAFENKQAGKVPVTSPESFVQQLRLKGYYTVGIGKISHSPDGYIYKYLEPRSNKMELPNSWDEMLFNAGKWQTGWNAFFGYASGNNRNAEKNAVKPYEEGDVDDEGYPDGLTAKLAEQKLKELSGKKQPFFLGVGFFKPHLPFNVPKRYWDMYKEKYLPLTPSPAIPKNVNPASLHQSAEFNAYKLGDEKASLAAPVSDAYARKLRHAYFASVSYVDAQVGKVLATLKKLKLDKNTIIVLWGDHGWHLGDDLVWGKHTLSEWATRSPLMIRLPQQKNGNKCDKVISSVDIYPTLMELCNTGMPYTTDGRSLVPLLQQKKPLWTEAAYSYFNHGITLRTRRYRLTRYFRKQEPKVELYDHDTDPYENINIAAAHPRVVDSLMKLWEKGNTGLFNKPSQSTKEENN